MTKKVRKSERPMTTWLGDITWVPIAWRTNDSTITMRVKAVISTRIAGARLNTVSMAMTCRVTAMSCGVFEPLRPMFTLGTGTWAWGAGGAGGQGGGGGAGHTPGSISAP